MLSGNIVDILLGQTLYYSDSLNSLVVFISSIAKLTPRFSLICFVQGVSGIDQRFIHCVHPLAVLCMLVIFSMSARYSP